MANIKVRIQSTTGVNTKPLRNTLLSFCHHHSIKVTKLIDVKDGCLLLCNDAADAGRKNCVGQYSVLRSMSHRWTVDV